jgi:hypothetical protein
MNSVRSAITSSKTAPLLADIRIKRAGRTLKSVRMPDGVWPGKAYDIVINGVDRTFRDTKAIEAAQFLKLRKPNDLVQIRDCFSRGLAGARRGSRPWQGAAGALSASRAQLE